MRKKIGFSWRSVWIASGVCLVMATIVAFVQPQLTSEQVRLWGANLFQCLILAAVLLPCVRAAQGWLRELGYTKRDMQWISLWSAVLVAGVLVFLYFYFRNEKDIKVYDFSQYWIQVLDYRTVIANSIPEYLRRLVVSLSHEYTALPAFALQPATYLFGTSFTGFTQSIFVLYYFPAAFFLSILSLRLLHSFQSRKPSVLTFMTCVGFCALAPVFLNTLIQGYLDVVGVLVIAIMLNRTLHWNGRDFSLLRNLTLALLSVLLLLLRRWYAYYIVGFYFAIGLMVLVDAVAHKKSIWKYGYSVLINLSMIAFASVALILLLNRDILTVFLGNNYGSAYSAYKVSTAFQDIGYIALDTGYLFMIGAAVGFGLLVYHRQSRSAALRLLIAMVVAGVLFLLVQSLGLHHRYLITPTILIFIMVSIGALLQLLTEKKARVVSWALLAFCCVNLAIAFVPNTNSLAQATRIASTSLRRYPAQNQYYDMFWRIVSELDAKTGRKEASVYMLGENEMGPEYLRRIDLPNRTNAAPFLTTNSIVDLRDGFPSQMFFADFVLVPDPLVNTLSDVQQISYQIYDMFLNDPKIADYYTLDTVYEMDYKTVLNLYRKTKTTDRALVDSLKSRLRRFYPLNPFVYEPNYFLALSSFETSMYHYDFYSKELDFVASPGEPATFMLHDTGSFTDMSFNLRTNTPGFDLVVENQTGEIYRANIAAADTQYQVNVSGSEYLQVSISPREDAAPQSWFVLRYQDDSLR